MAKGKQGVGSVTVWMIIFAALFLTASVFLVVLYTAQEELRNDSDRLRKANDRLISSSEENALELVRTARPSQEGGPTVVGLLEGARGETAFLATGNEADDVAAIRSKRDLLVTTIVTGGLLSGSDALQDASLYEMLTTLYESFKGESGRRLAAEDRVESLDAEVARLVQLNADLKNDFDERAKSLSDQAAAAEAGRVAYRGDRDTAMAKLESDFEAQRSQCSADVTAARQTTAALKRQLAELQRRLAEREARFADQLIGPEPLATARQPDGTVLTAVPGDGVVYVDLGSDDGVLLGLQFSVYPASSGIPADGRAKGVIEVASVDRSYAECKIVRADGAILEGDLIANPIYDAARSLTFLVIGEFDLNHDGEFDAEGSATIEAMIDSWGGITATELTALTDFVIVGGPPRRPRPPDDVPSDQQERNRSRRRAWDRYADLVGTATNLAVPMMTQDVFLNFLGFAGRPVAR